jgi:hypothetical protein
MAFFWRADDAAAVVHSRFKQTDWQARAVAYRPAEVVPDGRVLMVVFRYEGYAELFALR